MVPGVFGSFVLTSYMKPSWFPFSSKNSVTSGHFESCSQDLISLGPTHSLVGASCDSKEGKDKRGSLVLGNLKIAIVGRVILLFKKKIVSFSGLKSENGNQLGSI